MFELLLGLSLHYGFEGDYNAIHPHARYTHESVIGGVYYNSESTLSAYLGYDFILSDKTSLELGAVTGYSSGTLLPFARFVYEEDNYSLFAAPALETYNGKNNVGVVIGIEIPIMRNNNGTHRTLPSDGESSRSSLSRY
jgi:hypothetical protein